MKNVVGTIYTAIYLPSGYSSRILQFRNIRYVQQQRLLHKIKLGSIYVIYTTPAISKTLLRAWSLNSTCLGNKDLVKSLISSHNNTKKTLSHSL